MSSFCGKYNVDKSIVSFGRERVDKLKIAGERDFYGVDGLRQKSVVVAAAETQSPAVNVERRAWNNHAINMRGLDILSSV